MSITHETGDQPEREAPMPDLRRCIRLAGELLAELKAQEQNKGELGEVLGQFLGEADELSGMAGADEPDAAEPDEDWPILTILKHRHSDEPGERITYDEIAESEADQFRGADDFAVETYYPASHPRVLSREEAEMLAICATTDKTPVQEILDRLEANRDDR